MLALWLAQVTIWFWLPETVIVSHPSQVSSEGSSLLTVRCSSPIFTNLEMLHELLGGFAILPNPFEC